MSFNSLFTWPARNFTVLVHPHRFQKNDDNTDV